MTIIGSEYELAQSYEEGEIPVSTKFYWILLLLPVLAILMFMAFKAK